MPLPPPIKPTSSNSLILYSHLGNGPLIDKLSPGFKEWMYFDALPLSYFLTMSTNSPSLSEGEIGVYGRTIGLPLASFKTSGSDALTTIQDATGKSDAWPSGNSNINLEAISAL